MTVNELGVTKMLRSFSAKNSCFFNFYQKSGLNRVSKPLFGLFSLRIGPFFSILLFFVYPPPSVLLAQDDDDFPILHLEGVEDHQGGVSLTEAFSASSQSLEDYRRNPVDVNSGDLWKLVELGILEKGDWKAIEDYKDLRGPFISIYELQAVRQLKLTDLKRLSMFVTVKVNRQVSAILNDTEDCETRLRFTWRRLMESPEGQLTSKFRGDQNSIFGEVLHQAPGNLKLRASFEKDAGESFGPLHRNAGFDFSSQAIAWQPRIGKVTKMILGDFQSRFGQGLILNMLPFQPGSGSRISRGYGLKLFKMHSSRDENNHLRGVAFEMEPSKNMSFFTFYSRNAVDANIQKDAAGEVESFSSLQSTGLHRTESEIEDRESILTSIWGMSLSYSLRRLTTISMNMIDISYSAAWAPRLRAYNQFAFNGRDHRFGSVDIRTAINGHSLFGEFALADNAAQSFIVGYVASLDPSWDISLIYRYGDKRYSAPFASNTFFLFNRPSGEEGWQLDIQFLQTDDIAWKVSFITLRNSWLRSNQDFPSDGLLFQLTGHIEWNERNQSSVRFGYELRPVSTNISSNFRDISHFQRYRMRLHYMRIISDRLTIRVRTETSLFRNREEQSMGVLAFQDFIYSWGQRIKAIFRCAWFTTDDYDSRIYMYENDVPGTFSIPAYFGHGMRFYTLFKFQISRNMRFHCRLSRTILWDRESIGSGVDRITGNDRTHITAQIGMNL